MFVQTKYRSHSTEIMDDFEMEGALLGETLEQLAQINKWLGGNRITIKGVKQLFERLPKERVLTIVDLGCGGGDLLRRIAKIARKQGRTLKLIGIDANQYTIRHAQERSNDYPEISYQCQLIPSADFDALEYDIVLCTLFLHHFEEKTLLQLLSTVTTKAKVGVIVNDLHRSAIAYFLFNILTTFVSNSMIRADGLTSILRGFKKAELQQFSHKLQLNSTIQWRRAFRYPWMISAPPLHPSRIVHL